MSASTDGEPQAMVLAVPRRQPTSAWPARLVAACAHVALVTASLLVALLLAEGLVRVAAPQLTHRFPPGLFVEDAAVGYRLRPGFRGALDTPEYRTEIRINGQGLRDDRDFGAKAPRRLRVLMLGDSFTMGVGVAAEDTAARQLEERLNADGGTRVEVVNTGVPGYSTNQEVAYLRRYGLALAPDLILLDFFIGNDVADNLEEPLKVDDGYLVSPHENHEGFLPFPVRRFLSIHSQLYHLAWPYKQRLLGGGDPPNAVPPVTAATFRSGADAPPQWGPTFAALRAAIDLARSRGVPLGVVLIPDRVQVDPAQWRTLLGQLPAGGADSSWSAPNERLARFCREAGVPVADLLPPLRARGNPGELYYSLDHHWTAAGNQVAAEALAPIVRAWTAPPREPRS